ncbi:hypothetical protein Tco_1539313 [Tanacetum coccineum]
MTYRGVFDDDTVFRRFELKHKLLNVSEMESKDNFQKSKVKWAVEGDENSKFFHGIINKRRAQLAIRGIFVDGFWETEPGMIKDAFFNHFASRFKEPANHRFKLNFEFNKKLHQNQMEDLERSVSRDEIRRAVWSCGDNKSPGPDGFTFEFFKKYWDCIGTAPSKSILAESCLKQETPLAPISLIITWNLFIYLSTGGRTRACSSILLPEFVILYITSFILQQTLSYKENGPMKI